MNILKNRLKIKTYKGPKTEEKMLNHVGMLIKTHIISRVCYRFVFYYYVVHKHVRVFIIIYAQL